MHQLVSIPFSHYCEVGRFALTRAGIPFREARYAPFLHFVPVAIMLRGVREARADRTSSRHSTPILRCPEGRVICNSVEILRYALPELFGGDTIEAELRELHDCLGPHARRLAYGALLADPDALAELADRTCDPVQARLFRASLPWLGRRLEKVFGIDARALERSDAVVRSRVAWADAQLERHAYLAGDRLTAVDIYFACMLAPILAVQEHEGYGAWTLPLERLPAEFGARTRELRGRPAGQHVLRTFAEERAARGTRRDPG